MTHKLLPLVLFCLLALVQLYVPARMIGNREQVLAQGKAYKFALAPLDPNDPFRGKYLTLQFKHNAFRLPPGQEWENGEKIYVLLAPDKAGYARIRQISKTRPRQKAGYLKTRVAYVARENHHATLYVDYPFNRYYLEESKALPAEKAYQAALPDSTRQTYALVKIREGEAVLEEVYIDGLPVAQKVAAGTQ